MLLHEVTCREFLPIEDLATPCHAGVCGLAHEAKVGDVHYDVACEFRSHPEDPGGCIEVREIVSGHEQDLVRPSQTESLEHFIPRDVTDHDDGSV